MPTTTTVVSDYIVTSSNFLITTNVHATLQILSPASANFAITIVSTGNFSWINTYLTHEAWFEDEVEHYIGNFIIDNVATRRLTPIGNFSKALTEPFTTRQDLFASSNRMPEEIICTRQLDFTIRVTNNTGAGFTNDYSIITLLRSRTAQQFTVTSVAP